ncbi:unnamed protein product, partial [Sphacelaria rigidula]
REVNPTRFFAGLSLVLTDSSWSISSSTHVPTVACLRTTQVQQQLGAARACVSVQDFVVAITGGGGRRNPPQHTTHLPTKQTHFGVCRGGCTHDHACHSRK